MLLATSGLIDNLIVLGVGAALTAFLGGVLAPWVKGSIDRRSVRFESKVQLLDALAEQLWRYWKLALRIAYYGRKGTRGLRGYREALAAWDSKESWGLGGSIQQQVSRARRLLPRNAHHDLTKAQERVVAYLDKRVEDLRESDVPSNRKVAAWNRFYWKLWGKERREIDKLLSDVAQELNAPLRARARRLFKSAFPSIGPIQRRLQGPAGRAAPPPVRDSAGR